MRALLLIVALGLWPVAADAAAGSDVLVLVASARTPLAVPDTLTVRKAFMGLNAAVERHDMHALINDSDPSLRQVFLQHVVGFSEDTYQRRVLTLTMQHGSRQPASFVDEAALQRALLADANAVSFMWRSRAERLPGLQVLRILWQP